jgi:hypothetical protein
VFSHGFALRRIAAKQGVQGVAGVQNEVTSS